MDLVGSTKRVDLADSGSGALGLAIQPDGKILAVGRSRDRVDHFRQVIGLVRYNTNGTPDRSFGRSGVVTTNNGRGLGGRAVTLQNDGKIVVTGEGIGTEITAHAVMVARYLSNGALDTRFADQGIQRTTITRGSGSSFATGRAIVIQPGGKIVIAGRKHDNRFGSWLLARYTPQGRLDGKVVTPTSTQVRTVGHTTIAGVTSRGYLTVSYPISGPGIRVRAALRMNGSQAKQLRLVPDPGMSPVVAAGSSRVVAARGRHTLKIPLTTAARRALATTSVTRFTLPGALVFTQGGVMTEVPIVVTLRR